MSDRDPDLVVISREAFAAGYMTAALQMVSGELEFESAEHLASLAYGVAAEHNANVSGRTEEAA